MRLFLIFFMILFLNAKDLEVVKFVSNEKPKISLEVLNVPKKFLDLFKTDTLLISHYEIDKIIHLKSFSKNIQEDKYKSDNFLLRLSYKDNKLTFKLYNLITKKEILSKRFKLKNNKLYPFMIHLLSYSINNTMGFEDVNWIKKRVVYATYVAPKEQSIFISDITQTYKKKIISGGFNIFPKWADKTQREIYYTKLERYPTLYKYNVYTGEKQKLLTSKGMLVVSDVKGDNLLLTLAINDQPDIYLFNVKTHKLTRITNYSGIDVNGKFYKNGIVFISDRLGNPFVYQKINKNVSKFLFQGKNHIGVDVYNDNVVISSRDTHNIFGNNTFNLYLVNKKINSLRQLTINGKNMFPNFSNDGSTIFFVKKFQFTSKFGVIRLNENKVFYFKLNQKVQSFDI